MYLMSEEEREVYNSFENAAAVYDSYLVFDSVRFADDSPRTEYIRSADDFIEMISRYVPIEALKFGNLYEGSDWIDPCYYLE